MTNHVVLNNIAHMNLKVIAGYSSEFGDNVGSVLTFPTEYGDVQREYPIFFRKNAETGEYYSVALLGFEKDENLFLNGKWNASYIPGAVSKGPFLIGYQEREIDGEQRKEPVIHIDTDHPKVSTTEGEPIFLEHGGNSPQLERIASILQGIQDGIVASKIMFEAFSRLKLIDPVNLDITINRDTQYKLNGFYTLNEDTLKGLKGDSLEELHSMGLLEAAFLVIASLGNVKKLIDFKNRRMLSEQ